MRVDTKAVDDLIKKGKSKVDVMKMTALRGFEDRECSGSAIDAVPSGIFYHLVGLELTESRTSHWVEHACKIGIRPLYKAGCSVRSLFALDDVMRVLNEKGEEWVKNEIIGEKRFPPVDTEKGGDVVKFNYDRCKCRNCYWCQFEQTYGEDEDGIRVCKGSIAVCLRLYGGKNKEKQINEEFRCQYFEDRATHDLPFGRNFARTEFAIN